MQVLLDNIANSLEFTFQTSLDNERQLSAKDYIQCIQQN